MKSKGKILCGIVLLLILWGIYAIATTPTNSPTNPLAKYAGKPMMLEFMTPTCGHCINMVPIIEELYAKYGERVTFISIAHSSQEDVTHFIATYHTEWVYLSDPAGQIFNQYEVTSTPTFIVIDSSGKVQGQLTGETTYATLELQLNRIA